jgi:hypothetical protein
MSRNGGYNRYRATLADENAWARSRRPKCCKLAINSRLRRFGGQWQGSSDWIGHIAGWLKRTHPEDERNQVSRDHLSQPVCPSARRTQEGAASPSSIEALDASFQAG